MGGVGIWEEDTVSEVIDSSGGILHFRAFGLAMGCIEWKSQLWHGNCSLYNIKRPRINGKMGGGNNTEPAPDVVYRILIDLSGRSNQRVSSRRALD